MKNRDLLDILKLEDVRSIDYMRGLEISQEYNRVYDIKNEK